MLLLCAGLIPSVAFGGPSDEANQASPHEAFSLEEGTYVEGEVLVLVDGQMPQSNARTSQPETQDLFSFSETIASTTDGTLLVGEDADEAVAQSNGAGIATMSEDNSAANDSSATENSEDPFVEQASTDARIVLVEDHSKTTAQLIDEYATMPGVLYVEPNYLFEPASLNGTYSDPYIDQQWFLEDSKVEGNSAGIGVEYAWSKGNYGGNGYQSNNSSQPSESNTATNEAVVAVIDTGVYYNHPDLAASMWTGGEAVAQALGWETDLDGDSTPDSGVSSGYDTYARISSDPALMVAKMALVLWIKMVMALTLLVLWPRSLTTAKAVLV